MALGKRILIVEDEFLIAIHVADIMTGLGFDVVGPVGHIDQAMGVIDIDPVAGAILDVNLSGHLVFPLAGQLAARNIPFILTSGYESDGLPLEWRSRPHLRKPVMERELARLAMQVFGPMTTLVAGEDVGVGVGVA